ncbi:ankyrin repeat-containing protein ITN1 [Oryza sativa Japonica Group]|uniref:ankyrin repeat-containing protein ITN1 n=1 Tax=Oryza sativa subsp. japonica TaxID=39947 RepID=UPI00339D1735
MDRQLLKAATRDSFEESDSTLKETVSRNRSMVLARTAEGNTCLHISSMHGHGGFCDAVLELDESLLSLVNSDGETPLLTAITSGHASLAFSLLRRCNKPGLSDSIPRHDNNECNALHHAIRGGHKALALELIRTQPALSQGVNKFNESPMYLALTRDYRDVFEELFAIPGSAHSGSYSYNVLHAAVKYGNSDIAKKIMESCPWLAREENDSGHTPMQMAVRWNKAEMLQVLLEHDWSLGYAKNSKTGKPLLVSAAFQGHVNVARELLRHCPDAPYCQADRWTCLHEAIEFGHTEFVEFILGAPQLGKLINMRDGKGKTALHHAVRKCNPKIVAALLRKGARIDCTMLDQNRDPAIWELSEAMQHAKTLNWSEVSMLMLQADPRSKSTIVNLYKKAKQNVTETSRINAKWLTEIYTTNTSLVAILIATITFAAAFTLPGGYSSNSGSEGLPIMSRKFAFQAFLVSDTLAMLSSLAVAFICILARWEDLEFLLYYRSFTRQLMWFAYMATTTAFATSLYTVLAPRLTWLAVGICILSVSMPIFTKVLGEWPILKLRMQLGPSMPEFLDMV